MATPAAETPPEGTINLFVQNKNLVQYGLLVDPEGSSLPENFVQHRLLDRETILEECKSIGFMSDFHPVQSHLEKLGKDLETEILLICDPKQKYGDSWLLCLTKDARVAHLATLEAEKAQEAAAEAAVLVEKDRLAAEAEAAANATYDDTPVQARAWVSATAESTVAEVKSLGLSRERPLITYAVTRPQESMGVSVTLSDRGADNEKYVEHRAQKNPDFELTKRSSDISLQASPAVRAAETQTTYHRPVNVAVQYEPVVMNAPRPRAATPAAAAATATGYHHRSSASNAGSVNGKSKPEEDDLAAFLTRACPSVEMALQHNETVEIFSSAFVGVGDEESVSNKGENELKELRTFNDITFSKNMSLIHVDWHPTHKGMLAVAPVKNLDFNERVELMSGLAYNSHILVWDFVDLITPQLMLESPQEISSFSYNRDRANLVAAGALNGQVVLWDTTEAMQQLQRRQYRSSSSSSRAADQNAEDETATNGGKIALVTPLAISSLDLTHKRGVADLKWLPAHIQVNSRGALLSAEHCSSTSNQFITVAGDGQVLFWDVRFSEIAEGQLPFISRKTASGAHSSVAVSTSSDAENGSGRWSSNGDNPVSFAVQPALAGTAQQPAPQQHPWTPLFRMQLKRPEGVGELSLCRLCLACEDDGQDGDGVDRRSQFYCSSEEGEIIFADWRPSHSSVVAKEEAEDEVDTPEYVKWTAADHSRPATVLERSPFFPELVLTIGDWNFRLWKTENCTTSPIFSSPASTVPLTTGAWSPTRPGMLYMARADGHVDVWDLTDSSYRPATQLVVAPTRISSMKFLTASNSLAAKKQQLLGVGDKAGNLHVFDVPRNLWRPAPNERTLMAGFIEAELGRVKYIKKRLEFRRSTEMDTTNAAEEDNQSAATDQRASTSGDRAKPAVAAADIEEFALEELEKINAGYSTKESAFVELMGVPPEDNSLAPNQISISV